MKRPIILTSFCLLMLLSFFAKGQSFTPNISADSLTVLKARQTMLKAQLKIYELKIKESEEESDVEKMRLKLLTANAKSKESAAKNNETSKQLSGGNVDAKTIAKIAKAAKDDMADAQKALDNYNKQLKRVEEIRSDIRVEEGKLNSRTPVIKFVH